MRVSVPLRSTLKIECRLPKYALPAESTATRGGSPMAVVAAGPGVTGGAPPARVVMIYCCARVELLIERKPERKSALIMLVPGPITELYHHKWRFHHAQP